MTPTLCQRASPPTPGPVPQRTHVENVHSCVCARANESDIQGGHQPTRLVPHGTATRWTPRGGPCGCGPWLLVVCVRAGSPCPAALGVLGCQPQLRRAVPRRQRGSWGKNDVGSSVPLSPVLWNLWSLPVGWSPGGCLSLRCLFGDDSKRPKEVHCYLIFSIYYYFYFSPNTQPGPLSSPQGWP